MCLSSSTNAFERERSLYDRVIVITIQISDIEYDTHMWPKTCILNWRIGGGERVAIISHGGVQPIIFLILKRKHHHYYYFNQIVIFAIVVLLLSCIFIVFPVLLYNISTFFFTSCYLKCYNKRGTEKLGLRHNNFESTFVCCSENQLRFVSRNKI